MRFRRLFCRSLVVVTLSFVIVVCGSGGQEPSTKQNGRESALPLAQTARVRRPSAALFIEEGGTLVVANVRSGTLSLVDVELGRVVEEVALGESLVDLVAVPDGNRLLVLDGRRDELQLVEMKGVKLRVVSQYQVSRGAAHVAVTADGRQAAVSCKWSRCLDVVQLSSAGRGDAQASSLEVRQRIDLPFAPGMLCVLPDGQRLVVADQFGGGLAVVDLATGRLQQAHELEGHNTRGLSLSHDGKRIILAQQILDQRLPTTAENIAGGKLLRNVLRVISCEDLSREDLSDDEPLPSVLIPLGNVGAGAGDPAGIARLEEDRLAVALAGVQQVALVSLTRDSLQAVRRVAVGRRPVAVIPRLGTSQAAVVNELDDSVTLLDVETGAVLKTIELGPPLTLAPQDRGEQLFFDARLSRDGWLSCHSCHTDGHTNGLLADTLTDNTFGTPKRTQTLFGTAFTYRWAWNGEMASLHDQVQKSMVDTLHGETIRAEDVRDIVSYLHTLAAPPPLLPRATSAEDGESVDRGRQIFLRQRCQNCHIPPIVYASHESYDVGLSDERGLTKFNPPSLRGVGQARRFFHDNRATSLESVFDEYQHPGSTVLSRDEVRDLVRFLKSL